VSVSGDLQYFHIRVGRDHPFTQPFDQGPFVFAAEGVKAAVIAHLSPLEPLRSFTPALFEIDFRRDANLLSHKGDNAAGYVVLSLGEASAELEGLQQNGEVEPGGSAFVAEQISFIRGQRPMVGQFVRVSILLHL
jgi:hypothetical protein